jgi:hypothetical protein
MLVHRPENLSRLPASYGALFDRVVETFRSDERVRAVWLHGALGRGQADAASDLDFIIAVGDEALGELAAGWQDWLAQISPTVLARPIQPSGSFYAMTREGDRFDVVLETVGALPRSSFRRGLLVLDKDGLDALVPLPEDRGPDPDLIASLIEEFLRDAANFPAVVVRNDWLLGVVAVQGIQMRLYQLFAEVNRPRPEAGAKQWSSKLTPEQRRILEKLPIAHPDRESVRIAQSAAAGTFLEQARPIAARLSIRWPTDLEEAVRGHLKRALGIDLRH